MNKFLRLNLQFFSADGGSSQGGADQTQTDNTQGNTGADSTQTGNTVPYERFKEVNDNYKSMKSQLDKFLKEKESADEESKKKQGEYEQLYTELKGKYDPIQEQFKQYQETFQEILKTKMESVPENMRTLVPQGNELEQLKWIETAMAAGLFKTNTTQPFGTQGANPPADNNKKPENLAQALAKKFGK